VLVSNVFDRLIKIEKFPKPTQAVLSGILNDRDANRERFLTSAQY